MYFHRFTCTYMVMNNYKDYMLYNSFGMLFR